MATITQENAKQIRDPMRVNIRFEAGGATNITGYSPTTNKSYDSTLADTAMSMRKIADLQDGGFPLDGTHEWYEDKSPSGENGKLGLRSIAGQPVSVTLTASSRLDSVTIESTGVARIEKGGTQYPSTGLDVIPIMANSATLTFYPDDVNGRVFIKYIVPGAIFNITNDNLINCNVALRSNLSADNPTWEESDMEVQFYYPYDISETLAYIQDDWPLTYQAGYTDEMSELRKFYLSEPGIQQGNIVTLHAVDASSLMDEVTIKETLLNRNALMGERWNWNDPNFLTTTPKRYVDTLVDEIKNAGIALARQDTSRAPTTLSTRDGAILPEIGLRDKIAGTMNLTATLPEDYRISFVDAGIPTFQVGEAFTNVWEIDEEDIAELVVETPRHINRVVNVNSDRKFDEQFIPRDIEEGRTSVESLNANQFFDVDFKTYLWSAFAYWTAGSSMGYHKPISVTPSRGTYRATKTAATNYVWQSPYFIYYGTNNYTDGTELPGVPIEMEPFVFGRIKVGDISLFSPKNLLNRPNQTIQFKFKGDPRMQPRDFLQVNRLDGSTYRTRIGTIEMSHEGGGTMATITAMKTNLWKE